MPKIVSQDELTPVFAAVAEFSGSATVEEIAGRLETAIPRRTLQRRLVALLVATAQTCDVLLFVLEQRRR